MSSHTQYDALRYELFREQAGALGIAGRQLCDALAAYSKHVQGGSHAGDARTEQLLDEVASKAYALILQREFVGFVHDNIEWLRTTFDLPVEVWGRIGST